MDRDPRMVEEINDVLTADAPYKDIAKIFARETELSHAGDKMAWVEGQMLGEADKETKAPISISEEFMFPGDHTDTRLSTSRGHLMGHYRPEGVGAGWGGYDEYYEWQANGQAINKDWVKQDDPDWRNKTTAPLIAVDEDGSEKVVYYSDNDVKLMHERPSELKTLQEKLWGEDTGEINRITSDQRAFRGHVSVRGGRMTTRFW
ncbi:hypothetical protein LZL87_006259 [Fusarium oxysporum]|uniref:Uncharacterized protein n=1 Tax=Fusarium oxysporum f. sp. rapae TaxID=485398 RepID=A0A8J5NNM6_FUSOX|nr:hypothetical protein Forpe1208_v014981 [Fusarium oxysporum f. sp. rapae]KAI7763877.1 hypothetical protein LZL87_006259 [Fusarium oxysporum]